MTDLRFLDESTGNVFVRIPSALISIIHGTKVTKDESAVEGVDHGEYKVRHHDEEHEVPDLHVKLVLEKCLTERMFY